MTDFTQDDLKHVYNKNDLLSFAKEYWGDAFDRAIELGYDEDKANQFVYGVMREYAFNETDKEGNLLVDKYPLRQIPTWEDFGGKDTVTRGRVSQYSQNPQDLVDIQFKANEIDDLLADKTSYEPNGLINSFTKMHLSFFMEMTMHKKCLKCGCLIMLIVGFNII